MYGMTSSLSDSGLQDSGLTDEVQENDIGSIEIERTPIMNVGEGLLGGDVHISELDDVIPLLLPRENAPDCDLRLQSQLTKLLGTSRMEEILSGDNDVDVQELMLQTCDHEDSAGCAIVRISLDEQVDEQTYNFCKMLHPESLHFQQLVKHVQNNGLHEVCGNKIVLLKLKHCC